jgi:GT2 family glycosyltransferase
MAKYPRVALIYLAYHPDAYLDRFVAGIISSTYPKECVEIIIVENKHPQFQISTAAIHDKVIVESAKSLPHVTYLPQTTNLGFSGGVNVGITWALEHGFDYVFLHNQDGYMAPDCLEKLVSTLAADPKRGAAQAVLMCYPDTEIINSSGNSFHYLGFGFVNDLNKKKNEVALPEVYEIGYASGAAVLLRTDLLQTQGMWDENFFFYHEDIEYSLRLKTLGYKIVAVHEAVFYHQYEFNRNTGKYYLMERNRMGLLLLFFKWPTLILFFPIALLVEIGMFFFALYNGWAHQKIKAYGYWLRIRNISMWLKKRKHIQNNRKISDRALLHNAVGKVLFSDPAVDNVHCE